MVRTIEQEPVIMEAHYGRYSRAEVMHLISNSDIKNIYGVMDVQII